MELEEEPDSASPEKTLPEARALSKGRDKGSLLTTTGCSTEICKLVGVDVSFSDQSKSSPDVMGT